MSPGGSFRSGALLGALLVGILVLSVATSFAAGPTEGGVLPIQLVPSKEAILNDVPLRNTEVGARLDTTWFGSYQTIGGDYYALSGGTKREVMWTFDRGIGPFPPATPDVVRVIPNGEGWKAIDKTAHTEEFFRRITSALDLGELPGGGAVPSPLINGEGSIWVGYSEAEADSLCWEGGAGYGNGTCTRLNSPVLGYDGSGDVSLSFTYWNDSEPCFDGTAVWLRRSDNTEVLLNPYDPPGGCANAIAWTNGFTDRMGTFNADGVVTAFLNYNRTITQAEIAGSPTVQIIFEFFSDGGWSDEDSDYATVQGPFGADDVALEGGGLDVLYDFEADLQGWTSISCNPVGDFVDIVDVSPYTILDPCSCHLENNVLEMHAGLGDEGSHPDGQHVALLGPICELSAEPALKVIGFDFDVYTDTPQENGVLIRPGAMYYPYTCPSTGEVGWSDRVGQSPYEYQIWPICDTYRYLFTDLGGYGGGEAVPPDAEKVRPIIELLASCEAFAIEPCSGITNFSPLFDNLAVWATAGIEAPSIAFDFNTQYQDNGSFPSELFDVRAAVPANIAYDKHGQTVPGESRDLLGDSLVIAGPLPGADPNTRWEARMWWRVARRGPFQADRENGVNTRYKIWKDRVSDGLAIDRPFRPQFTFGWMDSVQLGPTPVRNKFKSDFRENDDDFVGENTAENEMIWDDVLRPGTQVEYFITSHYALTPGTLLYFPDTTGGNFFEFEALPGVRTANVANCNGAGFDYCVFQPATLYVDAYNRGAQLYIENALRTILNGYDPCLDEDGCLIPQDRKWDRYDYIGESTNFKASIGRGSVAGSNNGFTVSQVLGYRAMIVNTGTLSTGSMDDGDFSFFESWLTSAACPGALNRQVFIMNGDKAGQLMESPGGDNTFGPAFMQNVLGATLFCDAFNGINTEDPDCGAENTSFCVRWLPVGGGPFGTLTDVDAYGNYCPSLFALNVFSPNGTGVGNRIYSAEDPPKVMGFAQMTSEHLGAPNYRTILDGVSYHHMTKRDAGGVGEGRCPRDTPSIVDGALSEIRAALRWGFGVANDAGIPKLTSAEELATCQGTWTMPADVGDEAVVRVNRLYPNEPNPFNPRTTLKFSLAQAGEVQIQIYDVNGRLVRTLVDGKRDAGTHSAVWDGTNDEGRKIGSGIYWSQMKAGSFVSSKKMVVLK